MAEVQLLDKLVMERRDGEAHVMAQVPFAAGEIMLQFDGREAPSPDRYSIQVAADRHLMPPSEGLREDGRDAYLWRFLNHSCAPNAAIQGRTLLALCPIAAGDEVTFDYNTTEYDMATPFTCRCGDCGGVTIRGYRYLSEEQRVRRRPYLAGYLQAMDAAPRRG